MSKRRGIAAPSSRPRIAVLAAILLGLFAAAGTRAVQLQLLDAEGLKARAKDQYEQKIKILPARGDILDRNGERLASSIPGASAYVNAKRAVEDKERFRAFCRALSLDPRETEARLAKRNFAFTTVKRKLSPAEEAAVREMNLPGTGVVPEPQRYYPKKALAGQVLGFTGADGEGLEGIEHLHEKTLGAKPLYVQAERDGSRQREELLARAPDIAAARGKSLVLTLDVWIQHAVEEELARAITEYGAKGGLAVVMDPATGAVLAMAQSPAFNPNDIASARPENRKNRNVVDIYEPGSTLKALFLSVLLDKEKARPGETVFCEQGNWRVHGRTIHDHERYGTLSIGEILKVSSNIGVAKLSQRLTPSEFYEGLLAFGLGQPTGIDLPGESRGLMLPPERWSGITGMTMAYGHGVSVTTLQLVSAVSALANGGVRMAPYIVEAVLDERGEEIERHTPAPLGRAVSERVAAKIRDFMIDVVHDKEGTGTGAGKSGYTVAGKTGTAWKPNPVTGGYDTSRIWASFVGFAPAKAPRIVALVALDEPSKGSRYGGVVAAPAFGEICGRVLPYLGVPPDREPVAKEEPKKPVKQSAKGKGTKAPPEEEKRLAEAGVMPDLEGMTMREALLRLERTGVSVTAELEGSGFAARQSPAPGSVLAPGAVCRVTFAPGGDEMN